MEVGLQNIMKAVREAYKKDLEFRKELARKEKERIERERRKKLKSVRRRDKRMKGLRRRDRKLWQ
jgi:hypothetical protein